MYATTVMQQLLTDVPAATAADYESTWGKADTTQGHHHANCAHCTFVLAERKNTLYVGFEDLKCQLHPDPELPKLMVHHPLPESTAHLFTVVRFCVLMLQLIYVLCFTDLACFPQFGMTGFVRLSEHSSSCET